MTEESEFQQSRRLDFEPAKLAKMKTDSSVIFGILQIGQHHLLTRSLPGGPKVP
jgi:hypothetical protein